MTNNRIVQTLELLKVQAITFLNEMRSFYPFGTIINKNGEIQPVSLLIDDNKISESEYLNQLTNILIDDLENEKVKTIGIAINTNFTKDSFQRNAIEFRVLDETGESVNTYLRYEISKDKIEFEEDFTETPWL
ncbi:MAG: hypothetical protein MUC49_22825 [Raineya sp.]|jgi:hypothetical protein|nr:hypothetical protein [Raineya sp.]